MQHSSKLHKLVSLATTLLFQPTHGGLDDYKKYCSVTVTFTSQCLDSSTFVYALLHTTKRTVYSTMQKFNKKLRKIIHVFNGRQ